MAQPTGCNRPAAKGGARHAGMARRRVARCGVTVVVRWANEWRGSREGCSGMLTSGEKMVLGEVVAKLGNGNDGPAATASQRGVDSGFNRQQGRALECRLTCAKHGEAIRRSIGRWWFGNVTAAELTESKWRKGERGRRGGGAVGFYRTGVHQMERWGCGSCRDVNGNGRGARPLTRRRGYRWRCDFDY